MPVKRIVRVIKNWEWPGLMQQTPGRSGIWENIRFTEEAVEACDYLIILNNLEADLALSCPPGNVWRVIQEPPSERFKSWHLNPSYAAKTFTCDPGLSGPHYIKSHPMVPWHVNRDYDFLAAAAVPGKSKPLSWITSTRNVLPGHKKRMRFLYAVKDKLEELELLGGNIKHIIKQEAKERIEREQRELGFKTIEDKWAALAPYKFALAVESHSGPDYWTEKIADCFLAWTVPIYYGCTNLDDYFPGDSFLRIDIEKPGEALDDIRRIIKEDTWKARLPALEKARDLVLNKYQFFPFLTNYINSSGGQRPVKGVIRLNASPKGRKRKPEISVIVCTYNREQMLPGCLESLANQRADSDLYEVLVINNNSTDNTQHAAEEFAKKHSNFHVLFEKNQGLSRAKNRGVKEAAADYVAFIDDDSRAPETWIQEALEIIREKKPDIFGGPTSPLFPDGKPEWFKPEYGTRGDRGESGWLEKGFIPGGNMFCRKSLLIEYGGFDPHLGMKGESLGYGEDFHIVLKALEDKRKVYYSREMAVEDLIPDYKKSLAFFIYSRYKSGKDQGTLKNLTFDFSELPRLLKLIDATFSEFDNALDKSKRNHQGFAFPENYIIEKLRKNFVEMGKRMGYFLNKGNLSEEKLMEYFLKNADPETLARTLTRHHGAVKMISRIISSRFKQPGFLKRLKKKQPGKKTKKGIILIYHRIVELEPDPYRLAVHPGIFEDQIKYLKNRFNIISLQELVKRISRNKSLENCVVITFDDGYTDNLYTAKPILEKYRVPATFFITAGMTGSNREYWWDELERIFLVESEKKPLKPLNIKIDGQEYSRDISSGKTPREALSDMHRLLRFLPHLKREKIMDELFRKAQLDRDTHRDTHRILNPEELRELARGKLVEIGCHSLTHAALNVEPAERVLLEISKSKTMLEQLIGTQVRSFSYPFGLKRYLDENVIQTVRNSGYACGISNIQGEIDSDADLYCLPRRVVKNWSPAEFEKQLDNFLER